MIPLQSHENPENIATSDNGAAPGAADGAKPPTKREGSLCGLKQVVDSWPLLSEPLKQQILDLIQSQDVPVL